MNQNDSIEKCCNDNTLISDPKMEGRKSEVIISVFSVTGMDCVDEVDAIQKSLDIPKVDRVIANLMTSQVTVSHHSSLSKDNIIKLINKSGVKVIEVVVSKGSFIRENKRRVFLVGVSGVLVLGGIFFQYTFNLTSEFLFPIYLVATMIAGSLVFPKAIGALKQHSLDMNVLMSIAVIGAFLIKQYSEGATVVFLFSLAEMLESFSVFKARKAIREVLAIVPQIVNLIIDKSVLVVDVKKVSKGQNILVRVGERVPLDGIIIEGNSFVNQSALTGESVPVEKKMGSNVFAGTINESGNIIVQVEQTYRDTKIANIIRLIEEAQNKKAPAQIFVDKFARIYTPSVAFIAVLVFLIPSLLFYQTWDIWFYRALVFLVIACPCALVIATPISIVSALTALAKEGIIVKGGVYLEILGKTQALAVDKTGTITECKQRVMTVKVWNKGADLEFLKASLSLEKTSTHPLARAIVEYCEEKQVVHKNISNFQVITGKGVYGSIDSHFYFSGNHALAHELNICSKELESYLQSLENEAQSVMIVGHKPHDNCAGEVLGIFGLSDKPRSEVSLAILKLHEVGVKEVVMLSGDNQRAVNAISKNIGIDKAYGDLLPEEKMSKVQELIQKHHYVGMVGDGINDAPAIAQASVGIAMGGAGTDSAIESADIVLMNDNLNQLAKAINHGKKTIRIIHFNIGFALIIKVMFILLGIFGLSNLWLAVAADMGASLIVIANSMRLLHINKM
ncbi:MAG: cation-translocating P-type ATPase [Bdellovibrionaceae bacterium]|nr:cation-translocating P-type ATPase [Pseudobdellovibrionaceae bacterium]